MSATRCRCGLDRGALPASIFMPGTRVKFQGVRGTVGSVHFRQGEREYLVRLDDGSILLAACTDIEASA